MIYKISCIIKLIFLYAKAETVLKLLCCIAAALESPLILYATQRLIDSISVSVLGKGSTDSRVLVWVCVLFIVMVMAAGLSIAEGLLAIRFQKKLNERFSMNLLDKLCRIEYRYYEDSDYHDILMRMGNRPQEQILNVFNDCLSIVSLSITVFSLVVLFVQVSPVISLLYLLIVVVMMLLDFKSMKMMNEMFSSQSLPERELDYYRDLMSDKHALLELKVFSSVSYISSLCRAKNAEVLRERLKTTIRSQRYFALSSACIILWVSMVILSLIQAVFQGSISLGIFVSLAGSVGMVLSTTESLSFKLSNVARKCYEVDYYNRFMKMEETWFGDAVYDGGEKDIIEFKNVYFRYQEESDYILKDLSMTIDLEKDTALVGENGSGKSTIVKLICRLYRPEGGHILLNGKDIFEYSAQEYHRIISVVFQDFVKYSLTIRENVAIGNLGRLQEDQAICSILNDVAGFGKCDDLDVPLGKIEEDGIDLSGGEWQKIAIARGCIGNSRLVIMDEPTAAMDPMAESRLYTAFMEVMQKSGTLVISHRMASARLADVIYVICDGRIEECGNHEELIQKNGRYRQMYEAQSIWYEGE